MVYEHGINDMPPSWSLENEWNKKVYKKWQHMLERVYSEKFHNKHPTYIDCTCQLELHWLSYFVKHITKIDGYDYIQFINGELELDKDIKSNGKINEYSIENCMFVSKSENSKQAHKTRNYDYLHDRVGENNPNWGKTLTEETKKKMSESHKGKRVGENNPRARKVAQYSIDGKLLKIWICIADVKRELGINRSNISECCNGKRKTAGGYIWKYID